MSTHQTNEKPARAGFQLQGRNSDMQASPFVYRMFMKQNEFSRAPWQNDAGVLLVGYSTPIHNEIPWNITKKEAEELLRYEVERIQMTLNSTLPRRASQAIWDSAVIFAQGRHTTDWVCDRVYQQLMWQGIEAWQLALDAEALTLRATDHPRRARICWAADVARS